MLSALEQNLSQGKIRLIINESTTRPSSDQEPPSALLC